jgi:outer membrane protein, heavy metal efflux system
MYRLSRRLPLFFFVACSWQLLFGQQTPAQPTPAFTWAEIRDKFEAANPTLKASKLNVAESKAGEVTAHLRPNPDVSVSADGTQITPYQGIYRPLSGTEISPGISYLHERGNKRELRLDQAKQSTAVSESSYRDQERTLLFDLRGAFVQVLQAKAVLQNARENLDYWNRELDVNRTRFQAGDIAQLDLNRQELLQVQFETDYETALTNLRTAKIQILTLLNDRTPIDRFDVTGTFDFVDELKPLDEYRNAAVEARPDLKEAMQNVDLAKITHDLAVANGSTDPTWSLWWTHNASFNNPFANNTLGVSVSIPWRIFDRNQGEKARTEVDIGKNERLKDAAQAQVFSDVDSAYYTVVQNLDLLRPYKAKYLPLAVEVRDKMAFSYRNGGASLLDYLDTEKSYRDTRLSYLNLIGSYMTAAAQMNMAVGREVIQ